MFLACLLAAVLAQAQPKDLADLLHEVHTIAAPGVPGSLCAFGPHAWPVVAGGARGDLREPVVVAAEWGKGRIVALGHNGYFGEEALATADTARFLENCVRWTARKDRPRVVCIGMEAFTARLAKDGITAASEKKDAPLGRVDVLVESPDLLSEAVMDFVREGGGLLTGVPGWGWQQVHPAQRLDHDFAGNRLLAQAGILWTDATVSRTAKEGFTAEAPPDLCQASRAIELIATAARKGHEAEMRQAEQAARQVVRFLPEEDKLLRPRLAELAKAHPAQAPSKEHPFGADAGIERLLLTMEEERQWSLPPEKRTASPAAADFPGEVPAGARRVTREMSIATKVPGWHSLGLYAAPGEVITLTLPREAVGLHLRVRIGAHTDLLWDAEKWSRAPEVSHDWPLSEPTTPIASPFGGLLYIEVPDPCASDALRIEVKGAVESPLYVQGTTTLEAWKEVRKAPAPWAELATDKVILTFPSTSVRDLERPDLVMAFWDSVLDACADLATIPHEHKRPERYVCDVQISAGYMHSGYPIMTHLDVAKKILDVDALKKDGWGFFHEMGHNHQVGDWTFEGTGEVTNNLWSVYVNETICGNLEGHEAIRPAHRKEARAKYLAGGARFEEWKKDPFLALDMYLQLKEAFGWEIYKKVFAEYRALPEGERPKDDSAKRDQWMVRFSRAAGKNLGPFYQAWGVPISEEARKAVAALPVWMPEGFPK